MPHIQAVGKLVLQSVLFAVAILPAQTHPAGKDSQGNILTVVEHRYPDGDEEDRGEECVPASRWTLQRSRNGVLVDNRDVVVECRLPPGHPWETNIRIEPNQISVERNGGAFAGFFTQTYQLSPWQARSFDYCTVDGNGDWRSEVWDWTTMTGRFYSGTSPKEDPCDQTSKTLVNLITPTVELDAIELEQAQAALGSCAMPLNASGRQGFLRTGRANAQDPMEVRLLRSDRRTLLVQVSGPASTARQWLANDRIVLWTGTGKGSRRSFALTDTSVARWTRRLQNGREAVVLRIKLPKPTTFAHGFTLAYQQVSAGRTIATSPGKSGSAYERQSTAVDNDSAGLHVACELRNGVLETLGPQAGALQIWSGALGRPPEE